jgi:hypothetical protein
MHMTCTKHQDTAGSTKIKAQAVQLVKLLKEEYHLNGLTKARTHNMRLAPMLSERRSMLTLIR